jgi:hypothetical protein
MDGRDTYLVRLWLPDRPGALGIVTSRLGALKGDVVGLEIIERADGQALDELVVDLPSSIPVELIVREVGADGDVTVEEVRKLDGSIFDPQLEALEVAAIVLGAETRDELAEALCDHVGRAIRLSWACVVERDGGVLASWGTEIDPTTIDTVRSQPGTIWVPLPAASASLLAGRDHCVLRARERQRLAALGRIADAWFHRIKERADAEAWALHPSRS